MTEPSPPTPPHHPSETDSLLPKAQPPTIVGLKDAEPSQSTGQKILDLAIPAAGALLIDPLMTLVDTAFVGRFSVVATGDVTSTASASATALASAPLAGMGSAAALLTFAFYLFNFLCTVTTPLVARQRASGNEDAAIRLGGQVLSLALVLGGTLTIVLLSCSQPLLRIMGTGVTGETSNAYALAFLSVRAFAAPAVLCMEASTGVLRGYLDTKTPIYVLIVANAVNFILDVILIVGWGMGPMGAAMATTVAEWMGAVLFLAVLAGKLPSASGALGSTRQQRNGNVVATNGLNSYDTTDRTVSIVPLLSIPPWNDVRPLIVASSSVFFRALVLQTSLSAAAAMAARAGSSISSSIGAVDVSALSMASIDASMATAAATASASIAAHQIGIQLWLLCSFFCDSLAAASQGLVADALGRQDRDDVLDVSQTIFAYSLILGLVLAALLQIGSSTHALVSLFTNDVATQAALSRILPLIILAQPLNALVFAADGVLQGAAEFPFQAKAMIVSGVTAVATFWALDVAVLPLPLPVDNTILNDRLVHVWLALIALQTMRGLTSLWKLVDRDGPINLWSRKGS